MIRYFRALAWLRWHLVVNSLRPTRKRDALERASRVFQVAGPVLFFLLFVPAILMMGILGLAAGWFLGGSGKFLAPALSVLRMILVFELILTLLAPLLRATQGAPPNLTRFLLLPIPARFLYVGEAFASFGDPWLAILTSALFGFPLGWMLTGNLASALVVLAAGVALLALLTGLGALSSAFTHLVFRNRRRGELLSMAVLIVIALGGMAPALVTAFQPARKQVPSLMQEVERREAESPRPAPQDNAVERGWEARPFPLWAAAYPPELYARCVASASERRVASAFLPLAILVSWAAGAHLLGSRIYRKLLETPEVQSSWRKGAASDRWVRVPGLGPAASAVAVAQVKLIFRTVQGKIAVTLTPLTIVMMGLLLARGPRQPAISQMPIPMGPILAFSGICFGLLTLEACVLNQFAMDRAGLTLEFLAPISDRELIRGKAAGVAILGGSRGLLCYLAALIAAPGGSPFLWLSALAAGLAVFFLLAPGGAIISTLLPKTMDLGRLGQAGKPHAAASVLGMFLILIGSGPSVVLTFLAMILLKSPVLALLLVAGWAAIAAAISVPLFLFAEKSLSRRRENLALVAQGR